MLEEQTGRLVVIGVAGKGSGMSGGRDANVDHGGLRSRDRRKLGAGKASGRVMIVTCLGSQRKQEKVVLPSMGVCTREEEA